MSADEKELSQKSFDNIPEGIQSLLDWIAGYHLSLSKLLFCAENMGSYVTELSVSSVSMGFSLALVCSLTIKKSIGLQRGKNDRIDAKRIANYRTMRYYTIENWSYTNYLTKTWWDYKDGLLYVTIWSSKKYQA